jgi:hypothetical protein
MNAMGRFAGSLRWMLEDGGRAVDVGTGSFGRWLLVVVLVTIALTACGSVDVATRMPSEDGVISTSITWRQPTNGAYENATLIFFRNGFGPIYCTETTIGSRVMHCRRTWRAA